MEIMREIKKGEGRIGVIFREARIGEDIIIFLEGGEKPHLGSVVLAEPGRDAVKINRGKHKEWIVAEPIAKSLSEIREKPVLCIAGIHSDNATGEEINEIIENCKKIEEEL